MPLITASGVTRGSDKGFSEPVKRYIRSYRPNYISMENRHLMFLINIMHGLARSPIA